MIARALITCFVIMLGFTAHAQRPKLDLKAYGGYHTHVFVYKDGNGTRDVLGGWQSGFALRVSRRELMGEIGFVWVRNRAVLPLPDSILQANDIGKFQLNSFEIPIKVGYIPVKTAFFKCYVFTGLGFRWNSKGAITINGEEYRFKPRELSLNWFNVDYLLGTQFDIGTLNLEVMYNLGVNNSSRDGIRTNSHEIHFNIGFWF